MNVVNLGFSKKFIKCFGSKRSAETTPFYRIIVFRTEAKIEKELKNVCQFSKLKALNDLTYIVISMI